MLTIENAFRLALSPQGWWETKLLLFKPQASDIFIMVTQADKYISPKNLTNWLLSMMAEEQWFLNFETYKLLWESSKDPKHSTENEEKCTHTSWNSTKQNKTEQKVTDSRLSEVWSPLSVDTL